MLFPIGTAWVYRGEFFGHGNAKKSAILDLLSSFGKQNAR
jgi:hypothetical protein